MITYGHARFIEQSIKSIIEQKTNFEFVLVIADDCSPDNTADVVHSIITTHPKAYRIRYHRHEKNVGVMVNFTSLMEGCDTRYLALCEGDDFWQDENKLQKQIDFLEANPDYVLSCHDAIDIDTNGELSPTKRLSKNEMRSFTGEELQRGAYVLTLTMCFRNVIRQFPPEFDHVNNGDLFLTILLGAHGNCYFHSDIHPAAYRVHPGGMWSLKSQVDRWQMIATSFLYFSRYFKRISSQELAHFYSHRFISKQEEIFIDQLKSQHSKRAWKGALQALRKLYTLHPFKALRYFLRFLRISLIVKSNSK